MSNISGQELSARSTLAAIELQAVGLRLQYRRLTWRTALTYNSRGRCCEAFIIRTQGGDYGIHIHCECPAETGR